ncbi:ABC transporter permease [Capsulimonas corticalis]|uniref:ABC transporter permease n=1 Tax=Capsulimonas corticalis TaxID=2219043 RepID=A0A402CQM0_9BACT|nr:ABC transporter permease [Capsulimonas corticalis]BDI32648.1 ABC transporter permease [Capsulimonas corticalis]
MANVWRGVGRWLITASTTLLSIAGLTALVVTLAGAHLGDVLTALYQGAAGSRYDIGNTLNRTTPLLLTGLGVAIAFRAKIWNIGGEGQFLVGAIAASAVGAYKLHNLPAPVLIPLVLVAGAFAGAAWGAVAGALRAWRGVPEVISTIMLNFVAAQLLSYLLHGPMQESTHAQPASEALPANAQLPVILSETTLHFGLYLALAAILVVTIYLFATPGGFALRVVGDNPDAARASGVNVALTQVSAMAWSGALCGLAGAIELSGKLGSLYENYAPGYGFTAVAVALLGRLNPWTIALSALFFGALSAGSGSMERSAHVSSVLIFVIQGATLLALLASQRIQAMRRSAAE